MKTSRLYFSMILGALLSAGALFLSLSAESIDGTTGVAFQHYNHVFYNGEQAQGFVYFADGFTVTPEASITMDCVTSVSGAIDLRGTGAVHLARDLALDSHVTFSDGGYFSSAGKGLVLGGNLRIPSGKVVHCAGDMVINGMGNTLHLEKDSQLFLDNHSTLTLRNMIIKTERSYPGQPALHVSTSLSKLCLDNVVLNLGNDLYLNKGQFFFHNDVVVTGTSALVYTSPAPSFVTSGSSLYFDHGTTFSYVPCTPSGNLLKLADASSTLAFDGATLKATGTGMQLERGQVAFSGEVDIEQRNYGMTLNSTAVDSKAIGNVYSVAWSPDGKYVAIAIEFVGLKLCSVVDGQLHFVQEISIDFSASLCWAPDGKYLVVGSLSYSDNSFFSLYFLNQSGELDFVQTITAYNSPVYSVAWSPDGKYLLVGFGGEGKVLKLYRFTNGQLQDDETAQTISGSVINAISWAPDGAYVAMGTFYGLKLYVFSNGQLAEVQSIDDISVSSVSWSLDGAYVAVGIYVNDSRALVLYRFSNRQLDEVQTIDIMSFVYSVSWSFDGAYIAVGTELNGLKLYRCANGQLAEMQAIDVKNFCSIAWSPDQKYLMAGRQNLSEASLFIYELLFTSQTPENLIELGDGVFHENNCAISQAYASTVNILNGELRIVPAGHALPSDPLTNVISGGTWKLEVDGAQRFGPGRYVNAPIVYRDAQALADGFTYNGLINFAQGFSVPAGDRVSLDLLQPVFGDIDLNDTASLVLENDVVLAPGVQLLSGGTLEADGKMLLLQGDASIPAGKVIHCAGDMVINGMGNQLTLEPHAQLVVDANATVTLRNMIIAPDRMGAETPALGCDASGKLCLDNVVLNLSNDLQIDQGTVFVHNDVVVSGTSALLYQSPEKFNIAPHGTLYMDHHTTFSFAPKSGEQERLNMHDISSKMVLDAAKFISTGDDLLFPRGTIIFDGVSHFEHYGADLVTSENFNNLRNILIQDISNIRVASWSPNGGKLLVGYGVHGDGESHYIQLYSFNGNELATQGDPITWGAGYFVNSIAWSPDGAYVAVARGKLSSDNWGSVYIYSVSESDLNMVLELNPNEFINKIAWSSSLDGDFITMSMFKAFYNEDSYIYTDQNIYVYRFFRDSNTMTSNFLSIGAIPNSISFCISDEGDYLHVALGFPGFDADGWIHGMNDDGSPEEICVYQYDKNYGWMWMQAKKENVTGCKQVSWSPDGNWIAAARGDNGVSVYQWTGSSFGDTTVNASLTGVMSVDWFENSKYLAVGYGSSIAIYAFNGVSLSNTGIAFDSMPGIKNVQWVPDDGSHLLGRYEDNLNIFNTELKKEFVPATGKKVHLGPKSDLNVTMMPGTRVNLHGDVTKH